MVRIAAWAADCDCRSLTWKFWNTLYLCSLIGMKRGLLHPPPRNPSMYRHGGRGLETVIHRGHVRGVPTNFDTDLVRPIIRRTEDLCGLAYGSGSDFGCRPLKSIADHSRAITFLITDGVLPSRNDWGCVFAVFLRRAVRFGRLLGFKKSFLAPS